MKTALSVLFWPLTSLAGTVVLQPVKDTTLFGDYGGPLTNGAGESLYAGRTQQPPPIGMTGNEGQLRRILLQFDVAGAVPSGAELISADLGLTVTRVPPQGPPSTIMKIHRVLSEWGEGTTDGDRNKGAGIAPSPGDTTWRQRFFSEPAELLWTVPGGDFLPATSASTEVAGNARYQWSGDGLLDDIAAWTAGDAPNHGWILIGDESEIFTAKRFNSRENPSPATRPALTLGYLFATEITSSTVLANGSIGVTFTTVTGQDYTVESSAGLSTWSAMPTVPGDGSEMTVAVPAPPDGNRLFVRIKTSD